MTFLILCTATVCSLASQTDIERLLNMAGNYRQVEQTILLLKRPNPIIDHVPCISPLRAEDFRHLRIRMGLCDSGRNGSEGRPDSNDRKVHPATPQLRFYNPLRPFEFDRRCGK